MIRKPSTIACVGALVAGLSAPALGAEAGQASEAETLRNEVSQLRAEVAELRQQEGQEWMTERRAEQVKTLVRDVLSDAETRSSLLQEGMNAGYDSEAGHFFLQDPNGNFRLNLSGQIQARWTYNNQDNSIDDHEWGFSIPRAKLTASGHINSPRLHYKLRFAGDDINDDLDIEVAKISYEFANETWGWVGETKAPFLREELTSSKRQLAVERSLANEVFTAGYVQGVGMKTNLNERIKLRGSINDGLRSGEKELRNKAFYADDTDLAVTGRVDVALAGEWDQMKDFSAWSEEDMAAFVGGAVHYEHGETGDFTTNDNLWLWTIDGSVEHQGWNAFASVSGRHTDNEMTADTDFYGFVAQGGYNINDTYEPFVRFEHLNLDGTVSDDKINLVTVGVNWFNNQHDAKFTADLVWALDEVPSAAAMGMRRTDLTNLGLLNDSPDEEDQVALRLQYQLLF